MFLEATMKRNPRLMEAAVRLHRDGHIRPNTYVIDMDALRQNVRGLVQAARQSGLELYMMTKQVGRNPAIAQEIAACGIEKAVAVDPWEALTLAKAGIRLGNVGHLVQIPSGMLREIITQRPEVITLFSVAKAREVSAVAAELGVTQKVLMKVVGPEDMIYEGQTGGFPEAELVAAAQEIGALPNLQIAGVTAFPCLLYDAEAAEFAKTPNFATVLRAAESLRQELNLEIEQVNTPSGTSIATLPILAETGATHGEPGHSFTGTTPSHANRDLPELPAMVYVTEVSHIYDNLAYVYGGGFYRRSNMRQAAVGKGWPEMAANILAVREIAPEAIDYHGVLSLESGRAQVGDTAIYSFRTQIFVTRAEVALVYGISKGEPKLAGIYDSLGRESQW
ncbi:MAG: YhfX family PLP-dependent enzyme [Firmicutes bacterium]|nr:YhfX family PLP-dependent enzyme [Bacillota bacterium]